jgi:lipocalin-like protein
VPHVSLAQDQAIVGVWKVKSLVTKEVASSKTVHPFGERMSGYHVYSKGGHFMTLNVGSDRKPPATANPTDLIAQRANARRRTSQARLR